MAGCVATATRECAVLKGIDPILTPEALHVLASMGHGDELVVADANFPSVASGRRVVQLTGADAPRVLRAVLALIPLDTFVEVPAFTMEVVGDPERITPPVAEFLPLLKEAGFTALPGRIERHAFYARAREAFAVFRTGEGRGYGNIIVKKGVVRWP
jgi:L-fucose mutarotase